MLAPSVVAAYHGLPAVLSAARAHAWADLLPQQMAAAFDTSKNGNLAAWLEVLDGIAVGPGQHRHLGDRVQIGDDGELGEAEKTRLRQQLQAFHPWRKGPYRLFGVDVDTEWRSDWKWGRLGGHIAPLDRRLVLDVGCGNGYHCWRMFGDGAKAVIGVDRLLLNAVQFLAIKKLFGVAPVYVLPLTVEQVPANLQAFDTVFSMGVLYHCRSPLDHLLQLKACLRKGGELVVETLVVDGGPDTALVPARRYANMRNVWFLPSCGALEVWLARCGFVDIRLVDVAVTTVEEQRRTPWMRFKSLADFLSADDPGLTCEGLPAPKRAIFVANCP